MSEPTKKLYWSSMGIEFELPKDCVEECFHQGDCYEDVMAWQAILKLNLNKEDMIRELEGYGIEGIAEKSHEELEAYCIWLAAGNIQDSEEWGIEYE